MADFTTRPERAKTAAKATVTAPPAPPHVGQPVVVHRGAALPDGVRCRSRAGNGSEGSR